MKFTAALTTAVLAGCATAQEIQSKPFHLVVQSSDKKLNGQTFQSCHEGAAIESLCLGYGAAEYHLNTTQAGDDNGILTYSVPASPPIPSAMTFYIDPSTNVALPLFYPGYGSTWVSFDSKDLLYVGSNLDDTKNPPTDDVSKSYYRWYVCNYNYQGYTYQTLNWVQGSGKPQNPSCTKVDVKRVFT